MERKTFQNDFYTYQDPSTGRQVTRLTDPTVLNHHPYFYNKMFTADGRYLFYSRLMDEKKKLLRMDLQTGESQVLLDEESGGDVGSIKLSADETYVYFTSEGATYKLNLSTLQKEFVYRAPKEDGWSSGAIEISDDGRYAVTTQTFLPDVDPIYKAHPVGWASYDLVWEAKPRCRLLYIDLHKQETKVIYEDNCWIGHAQIRPGHNDQVCFCHEGPGHKVDARLWFINADGTNLRCARPQVPGEHIGHEFWTYDGKYMMYVYRKFTPGSLATEDLVYPDTYMPLPGRIEKEIIMKLDAETLEETAIMEAPLFCHFVADRTGRYVVGDCQSDTEPYICMVDLEKKKVHTVCEHRTSWKPYVSSQDAHPHPAFTPDGQKVIFTTDKDGLPAVFMADVSDLL